MKCGLRVCGALQLVVDVKTVCAVSVKEEAVL